MRKVISAIALVGIWCVVMFAEPPELRGAGPSFPSLRAVAELPGGVRGAPVSAKEFAKVVFDSPVRVLEVWLQGTYLIDHDEERMERGDPCTHIYRMKDRSKPVVAFHCKHLNRSVGEGGTYTLRRSAIRRGAFELVEFQFAGSADGHGVPSER